MDIPNMGKVKKTSEGAHLMRGERAYRILSFAVIILLAVVCVAPFVLMLSVSLSSETSLAQNGYQFIPKEFSGAAYDYLWQKRLTIGRCYLVTIFVTVVGTLLSLLITSLFAYPLSRKDFIPRNVMAFIVFFSMLFNGGLTATYIIWTQVFAVKNTIWALLLPGGLMGAMNVLLVRNYYTASIPGEILEAARVDGAGELRIYATIMVPLSTPVLATMGLFAAIGYWNNWTNGLYYINDPNLYTIQVYLQKLMDNIQFLKSSTDLGEAAALAVRELPTEGARMAIAIVAIVPILLIYPFIQKQLIKGMVIGGVKG